MYNTSKSGKDIKITKIDGDNVLYEYTDKDKRGTIMRGRLSEIKDKFSKKQ